MAEKTIQEIILEEIKDIKESQNHQVKQLSNIELRLGIIEYDVKTLSSRVNGINGCTSELADEVDMLSDIEEKRSNRKRSRKEKIYLACKIIGAVCAIGGLIVAIIL